MPSYQPVPGKLSSVSIGSLSVKIPFNMYGWTGRANLLDASSFNGEGYEELVCGLVSGAFVLAGVWNAAHNTFLQAPRLRIGETIANLYIKIHGTTIAHAESAIVQYCDVKSTPAGNVLYVYALKADWKFKDFSGNYAGAAAGPSYT